ncbi:FAD-dependent monooxygenase [Microlunatus speluncae]|uniref:FAD-dependent monooxygenase n=1 Tax=Microlunatus speluncae TaxID=2594267 RepID=UPI001375B0CA|nr:FAD-dependent monooxygenase [Microlunatus speluncae]
MTERESSGVPVVICGAGPAGLVAAIELARAGIEVTLVERRPDTLALPRATAISTRTMEILRSWGLEPQVRRVAMDVVARGWIAASFGAMPGQELQEGFPTAAEAAAVSPTGPAFAPQDDLERILVARLREFPQARVEFGVELTDLTQDGDGVTVQLRDVATSTTRTLRAGYLIGADGAASTVRSLLGITLEGPDNLVVHSATQFRAPLWDLVGDRRYAMYVIMNPEAGGVLVPSGQGDRWVYGRETRPGEPAAETDEQLTRLIRIATGVPDLEPRIERTGRFTFAAQVADRYRVGRGFVVGDAAHRITPRGGTGMNTAIHDGYDLGWKLAWVLSGWAGPELLDSYQAERRPVGARNAARSAQRDSSGTLEEALAADLGGRIPHAWVSGEPAVSTLDLLGPGLTVLAADPAAEWLGSGPVGPLPITARVLDRGTATALGLAPGEALVVRPDGKIIGRIDPGTAEPAAVLRALVITFAGRGAPLADARAVLV